MTGKTLLHKHRPAAALKWRGVFGVWWVMILIVVSARAAEPAPAYLVGAGSTSITPQQGIYLGGYGKNRKSTGHLDELWLKGVAVGDGETWLVLLTVDSIGLTRPDIVRIRQGVQQTHPGARVVVSSTHTHASPDVVGIWGPRVWLSGRRESYVDSLVEAGIDLAMTAIETAVPARSRVASDQIHLPWVENRSEKDLLDNTVALMEFSDNSGRVIATLTNFACHPTVLGPGNTLASADYVAGFYRSMAAFSTGEHLFLQGAVGGLVQPALGQSLSGNESYTLAVELGTQLADRVAALSGGLRENPYAPLVYRQQVVEMPLANWGFRLLIGLEVLPRTLGGSWYQPTISTDVSYFRIGQVEFATHPGETSPAYSLATRRLFAGKDHFVLGLAQDALGYILKPEYFDEPQQYPHADYLTGVSIGPDAGPRMMQALEELIQSAAEESRVGVEVQEAIQ